MTDKKKINFVFDDSPSFEGFTDGTTWNGWENVWCEDWVHAQVIEWLERYVAENDLDTDDIDEFKNLEMDHEGLYSYAYGYCTWIVEEPVATAWYPRREIVEKLESMGFENWSYGNDACASFGYWINEAEEKFIQIFIDAELPSMRECEEFPQFSVCNETQQSIGFGYDDFADAVAAIEKYLQEQTKCHKQ